MALSHPTISNLKGALTGHGARANLFEITLSLPDNTSVSVTGGSPAATTTVSSLPTGHSFWVKAGQVPGSTVGILPVNHGGRVMKIPGLRTFDDWTCTVINDKDAQIKKLMIAWMIKMSGAPAGTRSTSATTTEGKAGYLSEDIKIAQYSPSGLKKQEYTIHKAWPNAIADTPVDWGTDGLQEFTLTFSYDWWSHSASVSTTTIKSLGLEGSVAPSLPA